jgi:hypothetical protein
MVDGMGGILKGLVVVYSWYYPGICLERLRKTGKSSVRTAGVSAGIRTEYELRVLPQRQPARLIRIEYLPMQVHSITATPDCSAVFIDAV